MLIAPSPTTSIAEEFDAAIGRNGYHDLQYAGAVGGSTDFVSNKPFLNTDVMTEKPS